MGEAHQLVESSPDSAVNGSKLVVAKLRSIWKREQALADSRLKRESDGVSDSLLGEPLLAHLAVARIEKASRAYGWLRIESARFASDKLFHRWCREFDALQPCLSDLQKWRSLAFAKQEVPDVRTPIGAKGEASFAITSPI